MSRKTLQLIAILLTVIGLLLGLIGAGWSQRPIVDYKMDGLLDVVDYQYGVLRVSLKYRNRGNIDASLKLVLTVVNANITVDKIEPWIEYNETQVKFHVAPKSHMETYSTQEVKVYPVENAQYFNITYTFEDISNVWSINGMISHTFLEPHPYFPIRVMYNQTDTNTYEWIK